MAGRGIFPARFPGQTPQPVSGKYKTGETFKAGALLVLDANGELTECAADPASVRGVALEAAGSRPGHDMANSPTVVTGRKQEAMFSPADRMTVFSMRGVNGGTDPVTPTQTMIDEGYGALKDADGIWTLDLAETTAKVFEIADIDIDNKIFYCKFIEAVIQIP